MFETSRSAPFLLIASFLLILLLLSMRPVAAETAATIVVTDPANAVQAISQAKDGDTVSLEFSEGDHVIPLDTPIGISKNLTITGEESEARPVFDGQNQTRIFGINRYFSNKLAGQEYVNLPFVVGD